MGFGADDVIEQARAPGRPPEPVRPNPVKQGQAAVVGNGARPGMVHAPPQNPALSQAQWITVTDLPSQFLPYPPGSAIRYATFTWGEIEDINQSQLSTTDKFREIIKGIETTGFPIEELTLMDFLFIGIMRRISMMAVAQFVATIRCKNDQCRAVNSIPMTTDSLDFDYIKAPALPIKVSKIGILTNCVFTPIRAVEWFGLADSGKDSSRSRMMAMQMRSHPFKDAHAALYTADPDDIETLKKVDGLLQHGLKPIPVTCETCKKPFRMYLDGWEAVLIPFRGSDRHDENRITFGE